MKAQAWATPHAPSSRQQCAALFSSLALLSLATSTTTASSRGLMDYGDYACRISDDRSHCVADGRDHVERAGTLSSLRFAYEKTKVCLSATDDGGDASCSDRAPASCKTNTDASSPLCLRKSAHADAITSATVYNLMQNYGPESYVVHKLNFDCPLAESMEGGASQQCDESWDALISFTGCVSCGDDIGSFQSDASNMCHMWSVSDCEGEGGGGGGGVRLKIVSSLVACLLFTAFAAVATFWGLRRLRRGHRGARTAEVSLPPAAPYVQPSETAPAVYPPHHSHKRQPPRFVAPEQYPTALQFMQALNDREGGGGYQGHQTGGYHAQHLSYQQPQTQVHAYHTQAPAPALQMVSSFSSAQPALSQGYALSDPSSPSSPLTPRRNGTLSPITAAIAAAPAALVTYYPATGFTLSEAAESSSGSNSGVGNVTAASPAPAMLDAQLDWLIASRGGRLTQYVTLVARHGRRKGGRGAVAFGHHAGAESREVAVKFYFDEAAFRREADICSVHGIKDVMPPVYSVVDSVAARRTERLPPPLNSRLLPPMLVIEKGESLDEFVSRKAPDFITTIQLMVHIGKKLETLHKAGWVHRDLKPATTMWLPSQNEWALIDFGCCSRSAEGAPLMFSLYYAAPECIKAYEAGDTAIVAHPAADVWSLGVMAWELLSQTRFHGDAADMKTVMDSLSGRKSLASEQELSPEQHRRFGNKRFRTTVLQMLQREPSARPSIGDAIERWLSIFQETSSCAAEAVPEP